MSFEMQTYFESQLQENRVLFKTLFKFFYTDYESICFIGKDKKKD